MNKLLPEALSFNPIVRKPYKECPRCKRAAFGIAIVGPRDFHYKCAICDHHARHTLPLVRKTVIYLDQFVISNLMLVRSNSTKKVDVFYSTLHDRLLELLRLQAIVCPSSESHKDESVVHSEFEALRDAYESFGHSLRFEGFEQIKYKQILREIDRRIAADPSTVADVTTIDVLDSDPNVWFDVIRISVKPFLENGYVDKLKHWRDKTADGIDHTRSSAHRLHCHARRNQLQC